MAEAVRLPLVAWNESVKLPIAKLEPAVKFSVWPFAVREKGEAGETVSPAGRPVRVTVALPSNPPCGCRETLTVVEVPGATEKLDGLILIVKEGGAGAGVGVELDPPPPQPASTRIPVNVRRIKRGGVRISLPPEFGIMRAEL